MHQRSELHHQEALRATYKVTGSVADHYIVLLLGFDDLQGIIGRGAFCDDRHVPTSGKSCNQS
jgi:hypothetical protein